MQVEPQLIPEGLLVTVPDPVPDFETVNLYTTDVVKVVVTGVAAGLVTVKVPVPAYPPFYLPAFKFKTCLNIFCCGHSYSASARAGTFS